MSISKHERLCFLTNEQNETIALSMRKPVRGARGILLSLVYGDGPRTMNIRTQENTIHIDNNSLDTIKYAPDTQERTRLFEDISAAISRAEEVTIFNPKKMLIERPPEDKRNEIKKKRPY